MSGYIHLEATGVEVIDTIAIRLEMAGNGYHHTESWGESCEWRDDKKSYLDLIQDALNAAALEIKRLQAETTTVHQSGELK